MVKYLKMTGFILLFLAVYYIAQFAVSIIFSVFVFISQFVQNRGEVDPEVLTAGILKYMNETLIIAVLVALPLYMLICRLRHQNLFRVCAFKGTGMMNLVLAAIAGLSISVFFTGFFSRIPVDRLFPDYGEMIESLIGQGNLVVTIISAGILVPVIEEIIFRGLIYGELKKYLPVSAAVIIQGVLFGIYHMNLFQSMYASLIGLVLGIVLVKTGSILPSIILHAFLNNTSTVMSRVLTEDIVVNYGILMAVAGFMLSAAAIYIMWKAGNGKKIVPADSEGSTLL